MPVLAPTTSALRSLSLSTSGLPGGSSAEPAMARAYRRRVRRPRQPPAVIATGHTGLVDEPSPTLLQGGADHSRPRDTGALRGDCPPHRGLSGPREPKR